MHIWLHTYDFILIFLSAFFYVHVAVWIANTLVAPGSVNSRNRLTPFRGLNFSGDRQREKQQKIKKGNIKESTCEILYRCPHILKACDIFTTVLNLLLSSIVRFHIFNEPLIWCVKRYSKFEFLLSNIWEIPKILNETKIMYFHFWLYQISKYSQLKLKKMETFCDPR